MRFRPKHRRPDGTFVVVLDGIGDYHVTIGDALFPAVSEAAEGMALEDEPLPAALPASRVIAAGDFLRRFTRQERRAIRVAARRAGGEDIEDWFDLLRTGSLVDLDGDDVGDGLALLVAAGVLAAPRVVEILA